MRCVGPTFRLRGGCAKDTLIVWSAGKPGCSMAISGPGGINLLQGVAQAYFDSYPQLVITGQAPRPQPQPQLVSLPASRQHASDITWRTSRIVKVDRACVGRVDHRAISAWKSRCVRLVVKAPGPRSILRIDGPHVSGSHTQCFGMGGVCVGGGLGRPRPMCRLCR
jgi:hypothetical protein